MHSENVRAEVRTKGEKTKIAGFNDAMLRVREVSGVSGSSHVFIAMRPYAATLRFR